MKAVLIPRHGGAEVLEYHTDVPIPEISSSEVLVRVAATSVNQMDLLVRNGYPSLALPLPHVPGGDIVGTIERVGREVKDWSPGDRVLVYPVIACGQCGRCLSGNPHLCATWKTVGIHRRGGYAEYAAIPADNLVALPSDLAFRQAATLPVSGLTAHHALITEGALASGELAVIWGAAGGLGGIAVQIAHNVGARVVAVVSSPERAAAARKAGADYAIDRTREDVATEVRRVSPEGADLVFDCIGGETLTTSLAMVRNGGRVVSCGILRGREALLNIHALYYHHISLRGIFLGTREDMIRVIDLAARQEITPLIDRELSLSAAAEGQRLLESARNLGKIVLTI